jgi:hypothetical protein
MSFTSGARRRPTLLVIGAVMVVLAGGTIAFMLMDRGITTGADKGDFCFWVAEAMTEESDEAVANAAGNIEEQGVPAEFEGQPEQHGTELFIEMTESVGGGWEYWDGAEANLRGQDRKDLAAFFDYVDRECPARP